MADRRLGPAGVRLVAVTVLFILLGAGPPALAAAALVQAPTPPEDGADGVASTTPAPGSDAVGDDGSRGDVDAPADDGAGGEGDEPADDDADDASPDDGATAVTWVGLGVALVLIAVAAWWMLGRRDDEPPRLDDDWGSGSEVI